MTAILTKTHLLFLLGVVPASAETRFSFGAGGTAGGAIATYRQNMRPAGAAGLGIGTYLRLGVQFANTIGVEVDASVGFAGISGFVRGATPITLTQADWLTLRAGPVFSALQTRGDTGMYVGATIGVDFHLFHGGGVHALTIGVAADAGATIVTSSYDTTGIAGGGFLNIGYSRR